MQTMNTTHNINTVLLTLDEYNELRDFKNSTEKGDVLEIGMIGSKVYRKFIKTDEMIDILIRENTKNHNEHLNCTKKLQTEMYELKKRLDEFNDMSILKFKYQYEPKN